jgi:hypothetical protein
MATVVCAPRLANMVMHKIDVLLRQLARAVSKENEDPIRRFLVDIFMVWISSLDEVQVFLKETNKIHPTIKSTAEFVFGIEGVGLKEGKFSKSRLTGGNTCSPVAATPGI